ncbi:unnamed protein product, partial [Medioppia subpectinata]
VTWWAFIMCSLGVFLYQTLDALDGKQCYKVQNTQMEEVYDHGCDAVSTIFVTLAVSCAIQLGRTPILLFLIFLSSMIAFFSTHWLCHIKHQMVFGKIDVSEGQLVMVIIHLVTAFWGQKLWRTQVFGTGIELSHILALRRTNNIWKPVVPIAILTIFAIISYSIGYFHVSPLLFIFTFGFAFAKVTIKLVVRLLFEIDDELLQRNNGLLGQLSDDTTTVGHKQPISGFIAPEDGIVVCVCVLTDGREPILHIRLVGLTGGARREYL